MLSKNLRQGRKGKSARQTKKGLALPIMPNHADAKLPRAASERTLIQGKGFRVGG